MPLGRTLLFPRRDNVLLLVEEVPEELDDLEESDNSVLSDVELDDIEDSAQFGTFESRTGSDISGAVLRIATVGATGATMPTCCATPAAAVAMVPLTAALLPLLIRATISFTRSCFST